MTVEYLKKAPLHSHSDATEKREIVRTILDENEASGDAKALEYAAKFYNYEGEIILTDEAIAAASELVPEKMKRDIEFAHTNVKKLSRANMHCVRFRNRGSARIDCRAKGDPCECGGRLYPRWSMQSYRQRDHDSYNNKVVGGNTFAHALHPYKQNRYIEHGTFYSIFVLAVIMFLQIITSVPELITGLMSATIIGLHFIHLYVTTNANNRHRRESSLDTCLS